MPEIDPQWAARKTHGALCVCPWCAMDRVDATFKALLAAEPDITRHPDIYAAWGQAKREVDVTAAQARQAEGR